MSIDLLIFVAAPYAALVVCAAGTIERYRRHPFSCTSGSSQFLENRAHFWSIVPFHYGILAVLALHLAAVLAPRALLSWNAVPGRLYVTEAVGLAAGLLAAAAFAAVAARRVLLPAVRRTTQPFDWIVYGVLLLQLAGGVWVSVSLSWGSAWFPAVVTPYLASLLRLQPDISAVSAMPAPVKLHIAGAWLLLGLFPFSRLVHIVVVPHQYLWRPPQIVRWYARRAPAAGRHV
jgi:nitrate reductase gamma subunit